MNSSKWRALGRSIYHRLPLSQKAKWRLRERLHPFFVSIQQTPTFAGALSGLSSVVRGSKPESGFKRDNGCERALSLILSELSLHSQQFGPCVYWLALPFLAPGGAEAVTINLMRALREIDPLRSIVLLVTDRGVLSGSPELPAGVALVEFDKYLHNDRSYARKQTLLRDLLISVQPHFLHNINSEVSWNLIAAEGDRLKQYTKLYASIFAFQFGPDGKTKIGYAAYYLRDCISHLSGLISDNRRFLHDAAIEYGMSNSALAKLHVLYQPSRLLYQNIEIGQFSPRKNLVCETMARPKILWAGRLDAEKRLDLFIEIVKHCSFADFHILGSVVLDEATTFPTLPNLFFEGPFTTPLQWESKHHFSALLFTSKWEGLPNILIEAGTLGIPIIAPTVGGVGELINDSTGYPVEERPTVEDYRKKLQYIISDPVTAGIKAKNLQNLIGQRHNWPTFINSVKMLPDYVINNNFYKNLEISSKINLLKNSSESPVVSVIIPCYNQGCYLIECILSVFSASCHSIEVIVIDDGSNDKKSNNCLMEVESLYSRSVIVHRKKNGGLSSARNAGLTLARGEFIQFLDADDLLVPGKIDVQVAQFRINPKLDVSVCNFLLCDETHTIFSKPEEAIAHTDFNLKDFLYKWERGFAVPIHCGLFRRTLLENHAFDTDLRAKEDWLFWTKLALAETKFGYVHGHWAIYRQHNSSMRRSYLGMGQAWLRAGMEINALLKGREPLFFESFISWFEQCYRSSAVYRSEIAALIIDKDASSLKNDDFVGIQDSGTVDRVQNPLSISDTEKLKKLVAELSMLDHEPEVPLISVVIPIYNHYEYLIDCIRSVACQRKVPIEIICIDDGSPDIRVQQLLHALQQRTSRVKVLTNTINMGISHSQNLAVESARGLYIAFLDCDDMLETNALSIIAGFINEDNSVDYFFTDRQDIDRHGSVVRLARYGGYPNIIFKGADSLKSDLLDGMVASHLKVIKRATYLKVGGSDPGLSGVQDWDLALNIAEIGKFHYVPQALYKHRVHMESVTKGDSVSQFRKSNLVRRKYSERWLRGFSSNDRLEVKKFISEDFPVPLSQLKDSWKNGVRCVARFNEQINADQINFLREYNSYFDAIDWEDPAVPSALCGYLWSQKIINYSVDAEI